MKLAEVFQIFLFFFGVTWGRNIDDKLLKSKQVRNCYENFCYLGKMYPKHEVNKIIKKFNIDGLGTDIGPILEPSISNSRDFPEENGENFCASKKVYHCPEVFNRQFLIVNTDKYKQCFTYDICQHPKKHCYSKELLDSVLIHHETYCQQLYQSVKLLVIQNDYKDSPVYKTFRIPSGCSCFYKKTFGLLSK